MELLLLFLMAAFFVHAIRGGFSVRLGANEYTPGSTAGANLTPQVWAKDIMQAVYEAEVIARLFKKLEKTGEQIHVRKFGALGRTSPSDSTALLNLTYSIGGDTEVTATPSTSYVALALNFNFLARMLMDPTDSFRQAAEASVAEGVDVTCATLIDDLTSVVGGVGQNVTEATFLDGLVVLRNAGKALANPGNRVFAFHHNQLDDVIASTQNWSQYQITGRENGPVVAGELKDVYGCKFIETGNIQNIGGLFHNGLFIPDVTFGKGDNQVPTVKVEERDLARLVICWTDFAAVTIWSDRGVDYQTQIAA